MVRESYAKTPVEWLREKVQDYNRAHITPEEDRRRALNRITTTYRKPDEVGAVKRRVSEFQENQRRSEAQRRERRTVELETEAKNLAAEERYLSAKQRVEKLKNKTRSRPGDSLRDSFASVFPGAVPDWYNQEKKKSGKPKKRHSSQRIVVVVRDGGSRRRGSR